MISLESSILIAARAIKMHSAQEGLTWAVCVTAWLALGCHMAFEYSGSDALVPFYHLGCSVISTSDTYHTSQRYTVWIGGSNLALRMSPLWNFSGAWPLSPATNICNWRESSTARVQKLWPRKKKRELKAFHPFYWQWVKENSLEIFVRRGAQEVTVT